MAGFEYIDLGKKIEEVLLLKHWTKTGLGEEIGMSQSNAVYLTKKQSIDVMTLHKIGVALKYNFFKHYPIVEDDAAAALSPENIERAKMKARIAELEKQLEDCKRDLQVQKQENVYLAKINELLEKKQ